HWKAVQAVLERLDPTVQKVEVEHTHHIDHDTEALNQLRTLKALGVARDKLVEVFGEIGLDRFEKQLALEDKSTVVDAEFTEVKEEEALDPALAAALYK